MIRSDRPYRSMPVGVVMRRRPGVTRWARWDWRAVAVLPGARPADWQELRREGEVVEYHAATPILELHGAETEAYVHGLGADVPGVFVILRKGSGDRPLNVVRVTASPYEAQDYGDNGEDIVEKVPMPPGLAAWVQSFVEAYHQDQAFVKRRRDKARVDRVEDGKGDARIPQAADVYRSPAAARRRRLS